MFNFYNIYFNRHCGASFLTIVRTLPLVVRMSIAEIIFFCNFLLQSARKKN